MVSRGVSAALGRHFYTMRADDEERHRRDVDHARWRVSFLRSIVESHRAMSFKWRDRAWKEKDDEYIHRLNAAESEFERLENL